MGKNKNKELQQMIKNKQKDKAEIQDLVDQRVRNFLEEDAGDIETELFYKQLSQAKLGMVYVRDREIMKRITTGHMIRVINFITTDPVEKQAYVEASMPDITPVKELER